MDKNPLIDKVLLNIKIASDRQALLFELSDSARLVVRADGDCCSYTWIEHIELPALGFPARVLSVGDLKMPESAVSKFHTNPDQLTFYGCKITTDKGEIIIDYRNDSNGYYGGCLNWSSGEYFYGGVFKQNVSTLVWEDL